MSSRGEDPGTDAASPRHPRVLHLEHTGVRGGAEYALLRMLRAGAPWSPLVMLAPTGEADLGVWEALPSDVPQRIVGVRQPAGVSTGGGRLQLAATARLVLQAIATRVHPAFRTADIVDANTARAAAYGALAARTSRQPFVVHIRDMIDAEALGRAGHLLMTRLILPRADGVIADTHPPLDSARPYLEPDAIARVIPSASGLSRRRMPRPPGTDRALRVGMLARIDPWKGQRLLLDAFAAALGRTDARLEFAGDAPFGHEGFLAELRARADELGIADRVAFLGHVDVVDERLAQWDIAVQASTRPEPLGQNVLQYLAAGCATVVADEGGPVEWVVDGVNGLRVPPRDIRSLADALGRLGSDAALRERLGAAAAATPGLLDDAEVVAEHATFYEDVLDAVERRRGAAARDSGAVVQ